MENRVKLVAAAVLALVLVAAGIWYWQSRRTEPEPGPTIGSEIFEKAQDPLKDELPETNPFRAETNPFEKTEVNPFVGTYENPFD